MIDGHVKERDEKVIKTVEGQSQLVSSEFNG